MESPVAEVRTRLEATAAAFVKEHRLPGAAVGIVHEGELVWSKGIGFADLRTKRRSTPKTLYRIASITKTFTATAIMQLRDAGKLDLDDRAVEHIPELAAASGTPEQLTIRRMLSHESGLQSEPPGTDWTRVMYESDPAADARARGRHLDHRASEHAVEVLEPRVPATGRDRPARERRPIPEVRPHEAPHAGEDDEHVVRPFAPSAADAEGNGIQPRFLSDELEVAPAEHDIFGAEGGLWSCVEDLARWLSCQFDPRPILSEETAREMHKPRYLVDDAWTRAWAIGWYAVRREDVIWRMHSGGHYGFITNACFDPDQKVGAIALLNGFAPATLLAMELGAMARDAVKSSAPAIEPPKKLPRKWRDLPGLYLGAHFGNATQLEWRDGKLTFIDPSDPTWTPTLAETDEPDVFVIEPGFRESGRARALHARRDGSCRVRERRRRDDAAARARRS